MGLLRHGTMGVLFGGTRASSTLGPQLSSIPGERAGAEAGGRELLARLARRAPLLPGADVLAFIDIGSTQKRACGHKKQGSRFGHPKILGKSVPVTLPARFLLSAGAAGRRRSVSSCAPITPDRSGVPNSGAIVISNS